MNAGPGTIKSTCCNVTRPINAGLDWLIMKKKRPQLLQMGPSQRHTERVPTEQELPVQFLLRDQRQRRLMQALCRGCEGHLSRQFYDCHNPEHQNSCHAAPSPSNSLRELIPTHSL